MISRVTSCNCGSRNVGVAENRATLFWGPYNKDPTIYKGPISGSPILGNSHVKRNNAHALMPHHAAPNAAAASPPPKLTQTRHTKPQKTVEPMVTVTLCKSYGNPLEAGSPRPKPPNSEPGSRVCKPYCNP